jgi:hypothetical protein
MRDARLMPVLLALVLLTQPLMALAPGAGGASDGDGDRSGIELVVDRSYTVTGREDWDRVLVEEGAILTVATGGWLVTGSVNLGSGSTLRVSGGTLAVRSERPAEPALRGEPLELVITDGGALIVEGAPGHPAGAAGSQGAVSVSAEVRILIEGSSVLVTGGDGHSPDAPVTEGDVAGDLFCGGASSLDLRSTKVRIVRSTVRVAGGSGGDAPDGQAPSRDSGGAAGGYSAGGDVTGAGRGEDARLVLEGDEVLIVDSLVEVTGGRGGDAGDGGPGGAEAGGGGGGYSGGAGAGSRGPAGDGGAVTATGTGGDAAMLVRTFDLVQSGSRVLVAGGPGGGAGDGGDCDASRPYDVLGGGGGGGYSGGGGGAPGETRGTDGGNGGAVGDDVGSGGDAEFVVTGHDGEPAPIGILSGVDLTVAGGPGGRGGAAGTGTRDVDGWRAGGGGGAYTSGGGAGTSASTRLGGQGGNASSTAGTAGSGGDSSLVIDVLEVTVPANTTLSSEPGAGGACLRADAHGTAGGRGEGLVTRSGYRVLDVPMSRVALLSPDDGDVGSTVPTFRWARAHNSSSAGTAVFYEMQMDDDIDFDSPEIAYGSEVPWVSPEWVPNHTSYWRVRAQYERPWEAWGPWSETWSYTYINLPPVIDHIPLVEVTVYQKHTVDLTPYVSDVDDALHSLTLECEHPRVSAVSNLNITLYSSVEMGPIPIEFTVSDTLNEVRGQFLVRFDRYRHAPIISGLTNHKPPLELELYEGSDVWYDILVHDVDSLEFKYWTTGTWDGATAYPNGTLHVVAARGDVGDHEFTLRVADEGDREDSIKVHVDVLNVNDPPDPPSIISPGDRVTVRPGDMVSFSALVSDPDLKYGQVLNVTFISNETGVLREVRTTTLAAMSSSAFPVGQNVVTVIVDDGQYSASGQVVVNVEEPPGPAPVTTPEQRGPPLWVYVAASVVLFAVGFALGHLQERRRRREEEGPARNGGP